jgi:hypothetical protein
LRNLFLVTMPAKKEDSGYAALRGHIPKDLYKRFKILCLERGVDNSQGLEDLLREYFELRDGSKHQEAAPIDPELAPTQNTPAKTSKRGKGGKELK